MTYYNITMTMKEISIIVLIDDLEQVTEFLKKYNVGGISFYEINGADRTKREHLIHSVKKGVQLLTFTIFHAFDEYDRKAPLDCQMTQHTLRTYKKTL